MPKFKFWRAISQWNMERDNTEDNKDSLHIYASTTFYPWVQFRQPPPSSSFLSRSKSPIFQNPFSSFIFRVWEVKELLLRRLIIFEKRWEESTRKTFSSPPVSRHRSARTEFRTANSGLFSPLRKFDFPLFVSGSLVHCESSTDRELNRRRMNKYWL